MSALLTLDNVSLETPDRRPLFSNLSLSISAEKVGLVGRNGSGKSSLLAAIMSDAAPASGSIKRSPRTAMLHQLPPDPALSIAQAMGLGEALARLARIEAGVPEEEDYDRADWTLPARTDAALAEVGLPGLDLGRSAGSLSGGERTRVELAVMLRHEPDLLLLDEPTNNLDADGRRAVAELLSRWPGGALVASHDRDLLEHMDRIIELSPTGILIVGGGWTAFEDARDAARGRAEAALEKAEQSLRHAGREAQRAREKQDRSDKTGRAFASSGSAPKILLGGMKRKAEATAGKGEARSRETAETATRELDSARDAVEVVTPIRITLPPSGLSSSRRLLKLDGISVSFDGRSLFGPLSFEITGPERIAITGPNGSGKTSLIRVVMGSLPPDSGTVWRSEAPIALIDQHLSLINNDTDLIANIRHHNPDMTANEAHAALAAYGFRGRWAARLAGSLSGGERVRLALACLMSSKTPPQMLILDEPTNHLDIDATELLQEALGGYDGAILCISHDVRFRENIGLTREIALFRG